MPTVTMFKGMRQARLACGEVKYEDPQFCLIGIKNGQRWEDTGTRRSLAQTKRKWIQRGVENIELRHWEKDEHGCGSHLVSVKEKRKCA